MSVPIPTSTPSPSPFDEALQKFQSRLSAEQKQQFGSTSRKDVEILAVKLQEEQKSRKSHRALGLLRPFIDGLSGYAKIIEVFAQTSEILCFVWGPLKFLLQIGTQWQKAIDTLLDALSAIGEKLLLFEKCTGLILKDSRFRVILVRVYTDILEVLWTAMKVFGKKTHSCEQILRIHSPVFDKKLAAVISNLENDQKLIRDAVVVTNFDEAVHFHASAEQEFKEAEKHRLISISRLDEVMRFHANAETEFKEAAKHRLYLTLQIFRQELQPALLSTPRLEDARKISRRNPEAGEWLYNHLDFINWKTIAPNSDPVLALYGIPGAGKTTLSSIAFNRVEYDLTRCPDRYSLAHLALGFQSRQNNDCNTALKSLLYDQLAKYSEYAETVLEVLGGEFAQKLGSTEVLQDLLQEIFQFHRPVLLFVDGVDELPNDAETRKFLGILESFLKNCSDIRLFISCRPEELIQKKIRAWGTKEITLSNAQNRRDITAFTLDPENIRILVEDCGYDDKAAEGYLNAIVDKADGMFLYAKLVLNDLPDLAQGLQIDNLIEELPDGLDQIYDRSLQRIISLRKPSRKYAKRVFKFVLGGQRPLRASELQQAMVIEEKIDLLSTKRSISLPLLCGSLIEIMNDDTVCLVHSSLREYLLTKDNTLGLRHATIHRSISVACLTYLQSLGAVTGNSDSFGSLLRSGGLAMLSYTCVSLVYHLGEGITDLGSLYMKTLNAKLVAFAKAAYGLCKGASIPLVSGGDIRSSIFEFLKASALDTKVTPHSQLFQVIELFRKPRIGEARDRNTRLRGIQNRLNFIHQKLNTSLQDYAEGCDSTELQSLIRLYGPPFRCTDMKCIHFHVGFPDSERKHRHLDTHNRKFKCPIKTCPFNQVGFSTAEYLHQHDMSKHRAFSYPVPIYKYHAGQSNRLESTDPADVFTVIPSCAKADLDISGLIRLAKDSLRMRETNTASAILRECYMSPKLSSLHWHGTIDAVSSVLSNPLYIYRQRGAGLSEADSTVREEMAISSWHNAFDKVFQDGNRQFLPVSTLIEHVLFYGTLDVLKGLWSTIFTAAIRRDRERYLALAVMGANVSAVSWILSRFPLWSPFHALNMHVEFLSTTTKGPRFLARTNNIIPEILKVPIWFLVQWVQDDSVARTFENLMGYQEPGNPVYSSIFNSDLFLIASIIEDPSLINFVYSKTGVLSPSDYKLVLARMISTISSQEKQDQFYRILSSLELSRNQTLEGNKGLFCAIPMDDTLGLALSFSLLLEPSWSAELFLRGLVKSFDLGVSARVADVTKILERFESIPPYLTCRSKTEHLQAVDAEQLMSIIWPIIGMTPTEDYYEFSVLEQFVQETIDFLSLSSKRAGP